MRGNEEVERALISKLINKPEDYYTHNSLLKPSLFNNPYYKVIYMWLDETYQNGGRFDILKCSEQAKKYEEAKGLDSMDYTIAMVSSSDHSYMHETESLVGFLTGSMKRSKVKRLCEGVLFDVDESDIEESISKIEKEINDINSTEQNGIVDISERLKDAISMIEKNSLSSGITGITSGFPSIDRFTGGWQPQDLIIVGGASSMGKTSFSLALSYNASVAQLPSVVFSYEMSTNQLISRLLSVETNIDNRYLIKGTLTSDEWGSIQSAQGKIERLPLYIDDCSDTSLRYLLNRIRQYVITKGARLVMIDYLQLISSPMKGRSREQEVSVIARSLKNIAKELNITVMALSQLSRGVERNEGCRPTLSNLRESGEIEQAADIVMFVYRPEYYGHMHDDEGLSTEGKAEIIFAKGRNIGIGSKWLNWINYLTKFTDESENTSYNSFS
tara:strand:- start:5509 stop:6840 length:1332 start_codon:yes stop_codon:yes gene_type:complete